MCKTDEGCVSLFELSTHLIKYVVAYHKNKMVKDNQTLYNKMDSIHKEVSNDN